MPSWCATKASEFEGEEKAIAKNREIKYLSPRAAAVRVCHSGNGHKIMLASIIAGISAVAAIASAVFGYYQYRSAQSLARRNLRLEVQDLNRKLNEEVPTIKKMHEVRKQNLHASFSHAGIFYSSAREKHDREWEADGQKLQVAISKLEPCKRTFDDLDDHQLESKLMDLKTIERAIQFEREMAFEWEADRERMWTRVEAARKG